MHCYNRYAAVVLDISIDKHLDYGIPDALLATALPGARVEVPIRNTFQKGYIVSIKEAPDYPRVQPIHSVDSLLIPKDLFELALWMAHYYCTSLRQVFKTLLPATVRKQGHHKEQLYVMRATTRETLRELCLKIRLKAPGQASVIDTMLIATKGMLLSELLEESGATRSAVDALVAKGVLLLDSVRIDRSPLVNEEYFPTKPKVLNREQASALAKITSSLSAGRYETHLLHGVTGSGKTEVYLQAIDHALKLGKGAIMLVPEISLTQQTIERFRSRFEGHIAILHHRLGVGERFDEWHKIHRKEARIAIGARSAVFSPIDTLGLIIVDEEHEASYKQGEGAPFYHARDVAVMRGHLAGATVILGSATPSLESYRNAETGKYVLSTLAARADNAHMPTVTIVDMRREYEKRGGHTSFSDALLSGIKKREESGEQTILFLNRRGYHTTLLCQQCGTAIKCSQCDVTLTFHKSGNALSCHLCGATCSPPSSCPHCREGETMKYRGVGTEQIEKALHAIFPNIRTLRLDADTTRHKGSHQKLLRAFGSGKADVLIGTQMIAKGLHFPSVTLVGVLNSDPGLHIPDFRAAETTFQLITQVSGRAGRGQIPGEVIIQTCLPDHPTIRLAATHDFAAFYTQEIAVREVFGFPPINKMAKLTFSAEEEKAALCCAEAFQHHITSLLKTPYVVHPVLPSGYAKIKNRYRFQFLIRGGTIQPIAHAIRQAQERVPPPKGVSLFIDINPISTFF